MESNQPPTELGRAVSKEIKATVAATTTWGTVHPQWDHVLITVPVKNIRDFRVGMDVIVTVPEGGK